jgi:tetratricopeptide (TPR) repeat protein
MRKDSPPQSGSVSYGDSAQGNITITGGMRGDFVFGDKHVHEAAAPTVSALHQLPPPPADFTGREAEIAELLVALEDASLSISGLQGMGGVGKTALALKLAEKIVERYPDGQFYLDLRGVSPQPLTPAEAMAHVIHSYHPGTKLPESEVELRGIYLSVLHGQRVLLLMDDARDKKQVERLIPPAGCRLLVTSRQYFTLPGLFAKSLDCLLPEDACKLLLTIAPRIGELAADIAQLCGYLPFALRLAASAIAERRNIRPTDYTRQLADTQKRLELIEASLSLSYEILSEELRQRWRTLAVFPDSFDEAAAAAVWDTEGEKARDTLSELFAFSLVEWNETAGRYRLHDLAQVFADSRMSEAERDGVRRLHAQHFQKVLSAAHDLYLCGSDEFLRGLGLFDLERTNIEAGHAWAAEHAENDESAAELCITYPGVGAYLLILRHHPHKRIQWFEAMLASAIRYKRRDAERTALCNMGIAYVNLGEPRRAIEFYEQDLAITRETGNRKGEGQALGNLAGAYVNLGDFRRAIESYELSLTIARECGDRRSEGKTLGNLGIAQAHLGDFRRAIEFYELSLATARETGDRRGEGRGLGNLGNAYVNLGDFRRAIEFCEQHLAIARETGDRTGEGQALSNLGLALAELGDICRAIEFHELSLAIARETGDRTGEGQALGNLGLAYASLGDICRAIEFYELSLAIALETGDRTGEGKTLWNMALALDNIGERAQAIAGAEAALVIFEQIESPHAETVRTQLVEWRAANAADQT